MGRGGLGGGGVRWWGWGGAGTDWHRCRPSERGASGASGASGALLSGNDGKGGERECRVCGRPRRTSSALDC